MERQRKPVSGPVKALLLIFLSIFAPASVMWEAGQWLPLPVIAASIALLAVAFVTIDRSIDDRKLATAVVFGTWMSACHTLRNFFRGSNWATTLAFSFFVLVLTTGAWLLSVRIIEPIENAFKKRTTNR